MKEEIYNHRTKEGKEIPLNELETDHLKKIIALQKKKAIKGVLFCYGTDDFNDGDHFYDEELLFGKEALILMNHDLYVNELRRRNYKHRTKEGKEIPLNELKTDHLKNIIALQEHLAVKGILYRSGGGTCPDDFWYDEEELYGEEALIFMDHDLYVNELKKRQ